MTAPTAPAPDLPAPLLWSKPVALDFLQQVIDYMHSKGVLQDVPASENPNLMRRAIGSLYMERYLYGKGVLTNEDMTMLASACRVCDTSEGHQYRAKVL